MPKIPALGREQRELSLEEVYVPLAVVETTQAAQFYRFQFGEFDPAAEAEARRKAYKEVQSDLPVFTLLSEPDVYRRAMDAWWRRLFRRWQGRILGAMFRQRQIDPARFTRTLVLIGQAGSGKTTTLHFGALILARSLRRGDWRRWRRELQLFTGRPPLPIYARLTELLPLVERKKEAGVTADRLRDALAEHLAQKYKLRAELVNGWIERGNCLIMLDGLDETGDAQRRRFVIDLVNVLAHRYGAQNRLLVASRPFAGLERLHGFQTSHLRPLDANDIRRFLNQYFRALRRDPHERRADDGEVVREAKELYANLRANPRLFDMATNPLLLASMAILVEGREPLPVERAKVYERLLKLTLDAWRASQLNRNRELGAEERLYDESDDTIRRRLQHLARRMLEAEQREIALAQVYSELLPFYREHYPNWSEDRRKDYLKQLFGQLALHSGLIQARDDDRFSFSHFTLQEYLAARDFVEQECTKELIGRWREARWREAILLAIGHSATSGSVADAWRMLEQLIRTGEGNATLLAAEALDEANARAVPELNAVREQICMQLPAIAGLTEAWPVQALPDPRQRNRAATLLDRLGSDERLSLDLTRPEYWAARIEPGPFSMGDDNNQFICTIERPYALARFPVTNRQYRLFLTAWDGDTAGLRRAGPHGRPLRNDEAEAAVAAAAELRQRLAGLTREVKESWWKRWLRQRHLVDDDRFSINDIRRPRHWPGASYRPGEGNHPVVAITWYEATAFAWWAEAWLRALGLLADGEAIRLPTEPEWERAAAYPVRIPPDQPRAGRREYPWGDAFRAEIGATIRSSIAANTKESDIGGTSAVGIFPHGAAACGAEEVSGNVWEWCSTPYQRYPLSDLSAKTFDTPTNIPMILRGGSFYNDRAFGRCASRGDSSPGIDAGVARGFRLARLFSVNS
ncbi:hypothetical protein A6A03_17440 [Chloroflexus islandicus]|uniref:NACHT domain-containing protein n=1 Tax=Chloroflexus islandicus TaxID=1707952 RepID=A0A178M567_9CHLR|nr:hypothetical protein A6A03_17440 [Chloroflexus islandicus]